MINVNVLDMLMMIDMLIHQYIRYSVKMKQLKIGHTTNFEKRKMDHMDHMIETETSYRKVYEFIRNHGGWNNWNMIILATYTCKNRGHASRLEWFWWNKIGGSLNYTRPGINYIMRDMKKHTNFTSYINDMELLCRIGPPICDSTA